jgi:hypothetical protein
VNNAKEKMMSKGKQWLPCLFLFAWAGCTAHTSPTPVLNYPPGSEQVASKVPRSGVYRVELLRENERRPAEIPHTTVYLREGAPLGFRMSSDHRLVAFGGEYELPLELGSGSTASIAWYRLPNRNDRSGNPDPFAGNIDPNSRDAGGLEAFVNDPHENHRK